MVGHLIKSERGRDQKWSTPSKSGKKKEEMVGIKNQCVKMEVREKKRTMVTARGKQTPFFQASKNDQSDTYHAAATVYGSVSA